MNTILFRFYVWIISFRRCLFAGFLVAPIVAFTVGCGGGGSNGTAPIPGQSTSVVVLATDTANDQLPGFGGLIDTLKLTSQSGNTVSLWTSPLGADLIDENGRTEPLATVSIPQDIYTSATISMGITGFNCLTLDPDNEIQLSTWVYSSVPSSDITVTLPKPITISGASMGLSLDMLVSESASYGNCDGSLSNSYSITPTFLVTPVAFAAQPTNSGNGKLSGMNGVITSVNSDGSGFTVNSLHGNSLAGGPIWQVALKGNTVFQGIAGASQLAVGLPVGMDVAIQADGSLLATRVEVYDTDTANLSFWYGGPLLVVASAAPDVMVGGDQESSPGYVISGGMLWFDFSGTAFQISGQLSNMAGLPFPARFTAANMVAGQKVALTTHDTSVADNAPNGPSATTITLIPQTLNGPVSNISSDGGFTVYTIQLATYDLFPTFAVQPIQATLLTDPSVVVVYADSNTQMLNTNPIAVGSIERFYGLVFNDNGTLRMDCAQINDGVAE